MIQEIIEHTIAEAASMLYRIEEIQLGGNGRIIPIRCLTTLK